MDFRSTLSRQRSAVMGTMAILILLLHAKLPIPFVPYEALINTRGNIAVDVFCFLSGFGLAFSLEKTSGLGDFMARRLARILPPYYAYLLLRICVFFLFYSKTSQFPFFGFLMRLIPIGEWLNNQHPDWFVSAILGYYVIAALLYPLMRRSKYLYLTTALLLFLTGWFSPSISQMDHVVIAILRIPALVTGLAVGCAARREEPRYRKGWLGLAGIVLLALLCIAMYCFGAPLKSTVFRLFGEEEYWRLRRALFAPLLAVLIAYGFEGCERIGLGIVNRVFGWFGRYSLEFYLCQTCFLTFAYDHFPSPYIRLLAVFLLSCPFSVIIHWVGKQLYKLWMRLFRRLSLAD